MGFLAAVQFYGIVLVSFFFHGKGVAFEVAAHAVVWLVACDAFEEEAFFAFAGLAGLELLVGPVDSFELFVLYEPETVEEEAVVVGELVGGAVGDCLDEEAFLAGSSAYIAVA